MPAEDAHRVVLELLPGPGPIAGTLSREDRAPWEFCGWLELCVLLDRAREAAPEPVRDR